MNTSIWFVNNFDYFEIQCLRVPIQEVINCCHRYQSWANWTNYDKIDYSFENIQRILDERVTPLDATIYGFTPKKYPNISIFLNPLSGGLAVPAFFSYKTGNELFRIRCVTPNYDCSTGSYIQEFHVEKNNAVVRLVRVLEDGRMTFYEDGVPLPFENLSYYKKRSIVDRLSMEIVLHYMECSGFPLCDEELWLHNESVYVWHYSDSAPCSIATRKCSCPRGTRCSCSYSSGVVPPNNEEGSNNQTDDN